MEPPQVPGLHVAVLSRRHQQVAEQREDGKPLETSAQSPSTHIWVSSGGETLMKRPVGPKKDGWSLRYRSGGIINTTFAVTLLPGGGAEGQGPHGVVVGQEASVGQQRERPVRLPHAQQRRCGGQVPQPDHAWRDRDAV